MKTCKYLMLGLGLALTGVASAADVYVDGQVIQGTDVTAITIDPASGDINISASGVYTVTRDGGGGQTQPDVAINSFTASSVDVVEGTPITLSWVTTDALACTPSGGFGNWASQAINPIAAGTSSAITMTTAGSYLFTLNCTNDKPSSRTRNVTVNVTAAGGGGVPEECNDVTLAGSTTTWSEAFGDTWPNPRYWEGVKHIAKRGFLAIEFNTRFVTKSGGVSTIKHTSTGGTRLGAISECPGDFVNHLPDTASRCTQVWGTGGSISWSTSNPGSGDCALQPDTTYYFNLTFTDGLDPQTSNCTVSDCRTTVRVWKN